MPNIPHDTDTTDFYRLVEEIKLYVAAHSFLPPDFSCWRMGITADLAAVLRGKRPKDDLKHWQVWEVDNRVGWSLQNYFRGRSMQTPQHPKWPTGR
ncbi:MAG: hypothetical protein KME05_24795 [Gloeocapsa sp. UFS-A4-WI-NPMV-4B04]|jgi:hypothetical protein|nr:hypothetical protein [Gloeocapsa sp. UFS-A4-WI-NPMV-4B04]